jgi:DNA repair exonuclease SbcCD ATPase subunit
MHQTDLMQVLDAAGKGEGPAESGSGETTASGTSGAHHAATTATPPPIAAMPVAVRTQPLSADEAFRLSASLRGEQEALKARQVRIEKEESRLQIIRNDISLEKQEVDGLLGQVRTALESARSVVDDIQNRRQELEQREQEASVGLQQMAAAKEKVAKAEQDNLKQMSRWFQGMSPDNAAKILRELGNNGEMDAVIQMLGNIEDRDVARILTAVEDADLVAEIVEKFSRLPRPEKPKRR